MKSLCRPNCVRNVSHKTFANIKSTTIMSAYVAHCECGICILVLPLVCWSNFWFTANARYLPPKCNCIKPSSEKFLLSRRDSLLKRSANILERDASRVRELCKHPLLTLHAESGLHIKVLLMFIGIMPQVDGISNLLSG